MVIQGGSKQLVGSHILDLEKSVETGDLIFKQLPLGACNPHVILLYVRIRVCVLLMRLRPSFLASCADTLCD